RLRCAASYFSRQFQAIWRSWASLCAVTRPPQDCLHAGVVVRQTLPEPYVRLEGLVEGDGRIYLLHDLGDHGSFDTHAGRRCCGRTVLVSAPTPAKAPASTSSTTKQPSARALKRRLTGQPTERPG